MATDTMTFRPTASQSRHSTGDIRSISSSQDLARFLGWFSIGLGVSELIAPGAIARLTGTRRRGILVRLYGLREIAAGVGILTQQRRAKWLWGRVAGDVIDIASIVRGSRKGGRLATAASLATVAGVTAVDIVCAQQCAAHEAATPDTERSEATILIACTPEECYRFWHNVENFPRFLPEIRAVRSTGENSSLWSVHLPHTQEDFEWTAKITEDVPNERISWRSAHKDCTINGSVEFERAPESRGTLVRVQLEYGSPILFFTTPLTRFIGKHPNQLTHKALRRLKQLMEVGEIITTQGQSAGRRDSTTWLDHIAR